MSRARRRRSARARSGSALHANSLVGFQALIEKGPLPWLWPPIQYVLTLPTWLLLVPPGLLLVVACRPRARA